MRKKVIVISNFHEDAPISRSNMAFKYFYDRGFDTVALYSSFSHSLKKFRHLEEKKFVPLATIGYHSSLSFKRIFSYFIYSYHVYRYLRKSSFDILYVNLPPNTLALAVLLNNRKGVKLIVDILDLWPESFPHNNNPIKKLFLYVSGILPKQIRKMAIKKCDYCITESDFFFNKLNLINKPESKTIYIKKFQNEQPIFNQLSDDFSIVYLGNLGNIYDFESLFKIIKGLEKSRKVILHIIGLGTLSEWFYKKLNDLNIIYTDHGASFDESLKRDVLQTCWFGFNGYKQNTEVALSYKSVDYLAYGVPLLNSAKEDTFNLVSSERIGYNFHEDNLEVLIEKLSVLSTHEIIEMKKNAYAVFQKKFSGESYYKEMDEVLESL